MSILVTGGAGTIGSNICRMLAEQGRDVVAYDVVPASRNSVLNDVVDRVQVETGSINDLSNLLRVIKARKVEGIIHCAALVAIPSNQRPIEALEVNVIGTAKILEAARIADLGRIVILSTSSVMGAPEDLDTPRKEEEVSLPLLGIYRLSKLTCEQLVYTYRQLYKVDTIAVRPRTVFGPGSIGKSSWPLIQVIEAAAAGKPIQFETGGDTAFDFTYVKDSAKGMIQAYDCKSPRYYLYNLSVGENRTMRRT
jgi:UDP-glucose 4-epimerase